ncbi:MULTISPECIES: outer membrane protein [Cohaesibacter]|uniref:outer membrane protein n=1 Tax=Cohaesibacter TaxID=655352 RepID=UPI0010FD5BD2|nr:MULTISPECIES: outer membrane protein [Cohaesibacter]TLP47127.1 porin family protein [Cohaesibacter sp. CAU 1516]
MKKILCALAVSLASLQAASAADMQMEMTHDWSGIYAGLSAGYGFGNVDQSSTFGGLRNSLDMSGAIGGVVVGYNYQSNNFVFGVEADASLANIEGSSAAAAGKTCFVATPNCHQEVNALLTARARVGVAFDSIMPYVTGGLALAHVKKDRNVAGFDYDNWSTGFAVGAGVDYALKDGFSLRAEYLYASIEDQKVTIGGVTNTDKFDGLNIFRVGLTKSF